MHVFGFSLLLILFPAFSLTFAEETKPKLWSPNILASPVQMGPGITIERKAVVLTVHCTESVGVYVPSCTQVRFRLRGRTATKGLIEHWVSPKNISYRKLQSSEDSLRLRKVVPRRELAQVYGAFFSRNSLMPYAISEKRFQRLLDYLSRPSAD